MLPFYFLKKAFSVIFEMEKSDSQIYLESYFTFHSRDGIRTHVETNSWVLSPVLCRLATRPNDF